MQLNGLALIEFETKEAGLEVADQLIAQSIEEHGHVFAMVSYNNPLTDKYFYVESKGRTKTWTRNYEKEVHRGFNPKTLKALTDASVADGLMDGAELETEEGAAEVPKVFEKLKALADVGRSHPWASM